VEVQIGLAKIKKYASSESGDTLEVIERPNGGVSVVLADGQQSGHSAKRISNMVVRKVISLLAEGVRDGAAARAASDYLFAERGGKVQATLNIMSVDLVTDTVVLTRNNPAPILICHGEEMEVLDSSSKPVGIYRNTRPEIKELELVRGLIVVSFTDGLIHAGVRDGKSLDLVETIKPLLKVKKSPQDIANKLMDKALELDKGRPVDDISIAVLRVSAKEGDDVRRMNLRLPIT
jgi:serine phosphatase RsbU (regulator of sigma subunit)